MPSATKGRDLTEEEKKKSALYSQVKKDGEEETDKELSIDFPQDNDKLVTFKYNCRTTKFLGETDDEGNLDDTLNAISRLCKENALRMEKDSPPEKPKEKNW